MGDLTPAGRERADVTISDYAFSQRYMLGANQSAIVAALDLIDPTGDPERAHGAADTILLAALGSDVSAAYDRLVGRASWW